MTRVSFVLAWILLAAIPRFAVAAPPADDPDREIAQRRFARGSEAYVAKDYARAIEEFEAARRVLPSPEIDYNLARCHDRLEHFREAVDLYRRYVAARPDAADAPEVRARIQVLEGRLTDEGSPRPPGPTPSLPSTMSEAPPKSLPPSTSVPAPVSATTPPTPVAAPPAPPSVPSPSAPVPVAAAGWTQRHPYGVPLVVGGAALAIAVVGAALVASIDGDYHDLLRTCARPCMDPREGDLKAREDVGYALWGVAGAVAIVDVVLFVRAARHHASERTAWIAPTLGGLVAGGRF